MALRSSPSVEGRGGRIGAVGGALLYSSGSVFGSACVAIALSMIGFAIGIQAARFMLLSAVAAILLVAEIAHLRVGLVQRRWQVPQSWFRRWGRLAMFPAGFTLSAGFLTPVWAPTYYVLLLASFASPYWLALAIGLTYGAARSVPNWRAALGPSSGAVLDDADLDAMRNGHLRVRRIAIIALSGVAVAACAAGLLS